MKKVYRLLEWLDMVQALDYLHDLTGITISSYTLLQLCEQKQCGVYANMTNIKGCDARTLEDCSGIGIHFVKNPISAFWGNPLTQNLFTKGNTTHGLSDDWWPEILNLDNARNPLFKSSEIEALASKMNEEDPAQSPEKPLHPSERKNMERIIATLAAMAELDLSKPYKAAQLLTKVAAEHGLELPESNETIKKYLENAVKSATEY